jgi:peptidoglycan biosynthesis protein MviN/MurJ (putative lipid II flippase)
MRTAPLVVTQILALSFYARETRWTENVGIALAVSRILANIVLCSRAHNKGISHVLVFALAVVGAHCVDADGIFAAYLRGALVNVEAADVWVAIEPWLALTLD